MFMLVQKFRYPLFPFLFLQTINFRLVNLAGLAILICTNLVSARQADSSFVLSARVGHSIDLYERDYFGLFPDVKGFTSAKIIGLPDSHKGFLIRKRIIGGETDTLITLSDDAEKEIRDYVEDYESVFQGKKKIRTDLIGSLYRVPEKTWNNGLEMTVTEPSGKQITGIGLAVADSFLVLWQNKSPYDWRKFDSSAVIIPVSKISNIQVIKEGKILWGLLIGSGTGAIIGFISGDDPQKNENEMFSFRFDAEEKAMLLAIPFGLLGGGAGAISGIDDRYDIFQNSGRYKTISQQLKKATVFQYLLPPELATYFPLAGVDLSDSMQKYPSILPGLSTRLGSGRTETFLDKKPKPASTGLQNKQNNSAKFHFSIGGGVNNSSTCSDIGQAFTNSGFGGLNQGWFGDTQFPVERSEATSLHAGVDYNLTRRVRLGIEWKRNGQQAVEGIKNESEEAKSSSFSIFSDFVAIPMDTISQDGPELALGAGLRLTGVSVDGRIPLNYNDEFPATFSKKKTLPGLTLRSSFDYYFTRFFSLQLQGVLCFSAGIKIPSLEIKDNGNAIVKKLESHEIGFSEQGISLNVRVHL